MAINYRVDKVRFRAAVPVGGHVRATAKVLSCRVRPRELLELALNVSVELRGSTTPACTLVHTALHQVAAEATLPVIRGAAGDSSATDTPEQALAPVPGGMERNIEVN